MILGTPSLNTLGVVMSMPFLALKFLVSTIEVELCMSTKRKLGNFIMIH